MSDLLSVSEVAAIVGCSEQTVRIWIIWKELPGINVSNRKQYRGERFRVRTSALKEFLETRSTDKVRGTPTRKMPEDNSDFFETIPPVLTISQVSQLLDISHKTIMTWIRSGELTAVNLSLSRTSKKPRYRIRMKDLDSFLLSRTTNQNRIVRQPRRRRLPEVKRFF